MLKYNIFKGLAVISALALLAPGTVEEAEAKIGMKIGYPTTADPQHDYAVKFVNEVRTHKRRDQGARLPDQPTR